MEEDNRREGSQRGREEAGAGRGTGSSGTWDQEHRLLLWLSSGTQSLHPSTFNKKLQNLLRKCVASPAKILFITVYSLPQPRFVQVTEVCCRVAGLY